MAKPIRRLTLLGALALIAALLVPLTIADWAGANIGQTIIERCGQGQSLSGFSQQDYRQALEEIAGDTEIEDYSNCASLIKAAELAAAGEEATTTVLAQREQASLISGTIRIRRKGKSTFAPFSGTGTIPDGSEVEATDGHVLISAATSSGGTETAEMWGGRFLIHQERSGETRFTLTLPLTGCPRVKRVKGSAAIANAKHGPKSRHLWASENGGSWGTNGRYVITTVVGTHWLTEDECSRSRVSVVSGKVRVRNLVNNRTRTLTAGESYVAGRG